MKKAFTLLEIIFVIVLLGILAGVAVFYFRANDSELVQAKNQLINHIRYTQHLALMDDRFDPNKEKWYESRWQIRMTSASDEYYSVFSDTDLGGEISDEKEIAIDPYSGTRLGARNIVDKSKLETNIGLKYNASFESTTCDNGNFPVRIVFDAIGRPHSNIGDRPYENLMRNSCTITLKHNETGETATITIHPETGFVD